MAHEAGGLALQPPPQPRPADVDAGEPRHQQLSLLRGRAGQRHTLVPGFPPPGRPPSPPARPPARPPTSGSLSRLVTSSWMRTPGNALRSTCRPAGTAAGSQGRGGAKTLSQQNQRLAAGGGRRVRRGRGASTTLAAPLHIALPADSLGRYRTSAAARGRPAGAQEWHVGGHAVAWNLARHSGCWAGCGNARGPPYLMQARVQATAAREQAATLHGRRGPVQGGDLPAASALDTPGSRCGNCRHGVAGKGDMKGMFLPRQAGSSKKMS